MSESINDNCDDSDDTSNNKCDDTDDNCKSSNRNGKNHNKSDFLKIGGNIASAINVKMALFLFFLSMILFSDVFIDGCLSRIDNATQGECTTTKGTMIQITLLVIGYLLLDLLIGGGWL